MARKPRKKSRNGIYHVMLRGVNRQTIFEDDEDRVRLLDTIRRFKRVSAFEIYSYCLMGNHVHLLMKEKEEPVSQVIKRISSSYVHWYNSKYERCGHLFQGRYRSENVENSRYFMTVLRYIHQNPMKAGLVSDVFDYKWSSIHDYRIQSSFIDVDFALQLFSPNKNQAIQLFSEYMQVLNDDQCLDDYVKAVLSDDAVREYLQRLGVLNTSSLQRIEKSQRNAILLELKKVDGVTIRQLARVTGISKSVISRLR